MSDKSLIEWTDATWNPITGCSVCSAGCKHCYAMKLAGSTRPIASHPSRIGLTRQTKAGPVWTGEVRFNEYWLDMPLRWKRPRLVFVCAHADLFHENVPDEWIDRVFAVMALALHHQFQVLTKRAHRMRAYFADASWRDRVLAQVRDLKPDSSWNGSVFQVEYDLSDFGCLRNVWLGVSVEDQRAADERIPDLLASPAAVRWLSCEPLLGPVDLSYCRSPYERHEGSSGTYSPLIGSWWPAVGDPAAEYAGREEGLAKIDWAVVGGESGPDARPIRAAWVRWLRDQCAWSRVPFLLKQWGEWLPEGQLDRQGFGWMPGKDGRVHWWIEEPAYGLPLPDDACSIRIGKKRAGRTLDRAEHHAFPIVLRALDDRRARER